MPDIKVEVNVFLSQVEADLAFVGDLFVRKDSDGTVVLEIGDYAWKMNQWKKTATFGTVRFTRHGDKHKLTIDLASDLPDEYGKLIWNSDPSQAK